MKIDNISIGIVKVIFIIMAIICFTFYFIGKTELANNIIWWLGLVHLVMVDVRIIAEVVVFFGNEYRKNDEEGSKDE